MAYACVCTALFYPLAYYGRHRTRGGNMISAPGSISKRLPFTRPDFLRRLAERRNDANPGLISDARRSASRRPGGLRNTFYLKMAADEALQALQKLGLERFDLEFVAIPADGGCVVAVFASQQGAIFSRLRRARQEHDVVSLLSSIGATDIPHGHTRPTQVPV